MDKQKTLLLRAPSLSLRRDESHGRKFCSDIRRFGVRKPKGEERRGESAEKATQKEKGRE